MALDPTFAGLIGAFIGAIAGILGGIVSQHLQSRSEHRRWLLEKREEAYSNSIKYLLKSLNKRTEIASDGTTFVSKDSVKELIDDLIEAQLWLTQLSIYASKAQRKKIYEVALDYNQNFEKLIGSYSPAESAAIDTEEETKQSTQVVSQKSRLNKKLQRQVSINLDMKPIITETLSVIYSSAAEDLGKLA